jgi:hypothetical protein
VLVVWILTAILQSLDVPAAVALWHWFGDNPILTVLMIIFLA